MTREQDDELHRIVGTQALTRAPTIVERLRMHKHAEIGGRLMAAAAEEIERLQAAIAWTREVRPGKNAKSGGAIVHMTWDQFNTMRDLADHKP